MHTAEKSLLHKVFHLGGLCPRTTPYACLLSLLLKILVYGRKRKMIDRWILRSVRLCWR